MYLRDTNNRARTAAVRGAESGRATIAFVTLVLLMLSVSIDGHAQIQFEEKTSVAGHFDTSESWGASWGDLNGDLWPDLYVVNHRFRPSLFRNNGDGTFTNMALQVDTSRTWLGFNLADTHGGAWADFDADGDQDLSIATGTCCDGQLMVNDGGLFTESAATYGVDDDREGRLPLWLDYNGDGELDLSYMSGSSARLFENTPTPPFPNVATSSGIGGFCWRNQYAILSDIDGDDSMEYICVREGNFPMRTMDFDAGVFTENTYLPADMIAHGTDTAVGDFDGDLLPDILVMRGNLMPNQAEYIADANNLNTSVESWVTSGTGAGLRTITFKTTGPVTITAYSNQVAFPWKIFRGANGNTLPNNPGTNQSITTWTMDPADPEDHGLAYDYPGFDPDIAPNRGTYAGYDPTTDVWTVTLVAGEQGSRAYYVIASGAEITDLDLEGDAPNDAPIAPALLMNTGSGFQNEVWSRGDVGQQMRCVSAATADFDNDMDLDLYLVCRGGVENISNRLFVNDGTGHFTEAAAAGGAAGLIGKGLASKAGTGENVATADYDLDGYMDLFVTNGLIMQPFGVGAADQLFRNTGSGNHWLEVELKGTISNIEGIGAKILFTTDPGGSNEKIQLRERNGGYHRWSQNHMRTHVGLGSNTSVDVEVRWPSGTVDIFTGVNADQLVEITEGGTLQVLTAGAAVGDPDPVSGDECGSPLYRASEDTGIFLWKDCDGNGEWRLDLIGGDATAPVMQAGSVISSDALQAVSGISLESLDTMDNTVANVIDFELTVSGGGLDAFLFSESTGAATCLFIPQQSIDIYLGAGHVRVQSPVNLTDPAAPCVAVSVADVSVSESAASADIAVSLSDAASTDVSVDITTGDATATSGNDYTTLSETVTFAAGEVAKIVTVSIVDDATFESEENLNLTLSNVNGAVIQSASALLTIVDDDAAPACGQPDFDPAVDKVLAVWKDCGTDDWHIRASAGGGTGVNHHGALLSTDVPTQVTPFSFEGNDVINVGPLAAFDYRMVMSANGVDGVDFTVNPQTGLCLTTVDPSIPIIIGADGTVASSPIDLNSISPCITAEVLETSTPEANASALIDVALSSAATTDLTVDITTIDNTAVAGSDYTATTLTLTIAAGATTATATVPVINDSDFESDENFAVMLSNGSGLFIADDYANVTIVDDDADVFCGQPVVDPAVDKVLAVWKDCGTDNWHVEASAGGGTAIRHSGTLTATSALSNVTASSFEPNDSIDYSNPLEIAYDMWMSGVGTDRFNFEADATTALCLTTLDPSIAIKVGAAGTIVSSPVDLTTLGGCVGFSVADINVSESDTSANLTVTLSSASANTVSVEATAIADSAQSPDDFAATTQTLTFAPGQTQASFTVAIVDDTVYESTESLTVQLSNPTGAFVLDPSALVTIADDDGIAACGEPAVNAATDKVLALWKDCSSDRWFASASAGGGTAINHNGSIVADSALTNVVGVSLEGNDTVDGSNPAAVMFDLWMSNAGTDGFEFDAASGTGLCLTTSDPSITVIVGAAGTAVTPPVDLSTLASCVTVSVGGVSVDEDAGTVVVPITLSASSATDVTVDVSATDASAILTEDYNGAAQAVVISAGQLSADAVFTIVDDSVTEPEETFVVSLSNAVGAQILQASAEVTILDDDANIACGAPAIDGAVTKALYVWKDCGTSTWHMRATAGGETGIQHEGTVTLTNGIFTSTPAYTAYSMEGIDSVVISNADTVATYLWRMSYNGVDGMDFDISAGAGICLDILDPALPVLIGANATAVTAPLDLETQGACQ